jgi:hypothetical protein
MPAEDREAAAACYRAALDREEKAAQEYRDAVRPGDGCVRAEIVAPTRGREGILRRLINDGL